MCLHCYFLPGTGILYGFRRYTRVDDTLDVFPSHGIGGIVGMLLTAVFASVAGLIYGNTSTFLNHLLALIITTVFCSCGSYLLYMLVDKLLPTPS